MCTKATGYYPTPQECWSYWFWWLCSHTLYPHPYPENVTNNEVNFCYLSGPLLWSGNYTMTSFTIQLSLPRKDDCKNPLDYTLVWCQDDRCHKNDYFSVPCCAWYRRYSQSLFLLIYLPEILMLPPRGSIKTGRGSSSHAQRSEPLITMTQHTMEMFRFPPSSWNHNLCDSYPPQEFSRKRFRPHGDLLLIFVLILKATIEAKKLFSNKPVPVTNNNKLKKT